MTPEGVTLSLHVGEIASQKVKQNFPHSLYDVICIGTCCAWLGLRSKRESQNVSEKVIVI